MVELGKALLKSAEDGDTSEVKNLIGRGAPMTADWLGTSPLHKAAFYGHYQTAKTLLSSGCSRDARTKVDKTALHLAASGGHSSIIELLLTANAEVNPPDMVITYVNSTNLYKLPKVFWNSSFEIICDCLALDNQ